MRDEKRKGNGILPLALIILDGWGIDKPNKGNAITLAKTPNYSSYLAKYPNTTLAAHGKRVGLPEWQVGNSEAGHLNIGAGRLVEQDVVRVSSSIENGTFFHNAAFLAAIRHVKDTGGRLHIMGLLSNGMSPHTEPAHLSALLRLVREQGIDDACLHLFTDGRDSHQFASPKLVEGIQKQLLSKEKICTIMGRFYAMDRKKKWDRTESAYNALLFGEGHAAENVHAAISESYNRGQSDEFIEPYVIKENGKMLPRISDNDSIIFFNLRSDRGRQLTKVFTQESFNKMNPDSFHRKRVLKNIVFVAMTDFGPDLGGSLLTAYPSIVVKEALPTQLHDFSQLYIAESEKYAHVTYFFNGGFSHKVDGEDQFFFQSPDVASYDQTPEMKTRDLADKLIGDLKDKKYDITVLNFAAPDMIGHTGNLEAAIRCCEIVDDNLGRVIDAYLAAGGTVLVTADHGNIERMIDLKTGEVMTEHTTNPVPFILINDDLKKARLRDGGALCDISPTILALLGVDQPKLMTGKNLITK